LDYQKTLVWEVGVKMIFERQAGMYPREKVKITIHETTSETYLEAGKCRN